MTEPFSPVPDLAACLDKLLGQVPRGRVTTCGDLAEALGNRIAARWIGHVALHHPHTAACVCHRILRAGGEIGPYIGGTLRTKTGRLEAAKESWSTTRWSISRSSASMVSSATVPWSGCAQSRSGSGKKSRCGRAAAIPQQIGGVNVAYPSPETAQAAYALTDTATGGLIWSTTIRRRVTFPYISTYLGFREIPIYLELLLKVRAAGRLAEVLLVDGSGVLHHAHAGVASHLGVVAALPTVGVTKKLLCGHVDIEGMGPGESRPIEYEDRLVGVALRPTAGSRRPIFVSPGHRVQRRLLRGSSPPAHTRPSPSRTAPLGRPAEPAVNLGKLFRL